MKQQRLAFWSSVSILLATSAGLAQVPTQTVVRWQKDDAHSVEFLVQGHVVRATEHDGFTVAACLEGAGREMQVLVAFANDSKNRVDILPPSMSLEVTSHKYQVLPYLDPGKVAAKRHVPLWARMFAGAFANLVTTQTTVTGDVNATIRGPDTAARDRIFNNLALAEAGNAALARQIELTALLPNTVFPGNRITGWVYFARPKHLGSYFPPETPGQPIRPPQSVELEGLLRVPVGGYIFELPFKWDVKR